MQGQLNLSLVLCCGIATLQGVSNDSGDETIQVVAQDLDGSQVHIQQLFVLTGGIQVLVELQDLLLQGVQAAQMDLVSSFLTAPVLLASHGGVGGCAAGGGGSVCQGEGNLILGFRLLPGFQGSSFLYPSPDNSPTLDPRTASPTRRWWGTAWDRDLQSLR